MLKWRRFFRVAPEAEIGCSFARDDSGSPCQNVSFAEGLRMAVSAENAKRAVEVLAYHVKAPE